VMQVRDDGIVHTRWVFRFVYVAASSIFGFYYYFNSETAFHNDPTPPFHWSLPYQLRILVPTIEYLCRLVLPFPLHSYHAAFSMLSCLFIILSFRKLLFFFRIPHFRLLSLVIFYPLTWNYIILSHLYFAADLPAIAFFLLGLVYALERRWVYFYPLFFLALFNRESIIFVVPAYLLLILPTKRDSATLRTLLGHVVLQLTLFAFVKGLLLYIFRNNPGNAFNDMFAGNVTIVHQLFHGRYQTWGYTITCFGGLHILSLLLLRWVPRELRPLYLLFPIVGAVMFMVGLLTEVRIYGELVPIVTLLSITGAHQVYAQHSQRKAAT
jgi:hypothetical protein